VFARIYQELISPWPTFGLKYFTMSYAEQFKVGIINHPPYQMTDSEQFTGIYIDIFHEISKETGDTFIFKFFPVARLKVQFTNGQVDIEPGINPSWRQNEPIRGEYTLPRMSRLEGSILSHLQNLLI